MFFLNSYKISCFRAPAECGTSSLPSRGFFGFFVFLKKATTLGNLNTLYDRKCEKWDYAGEKEDRSNLLTIDLVVAVPAILYIRKADHGTT